MRFNELLIAFVDSETEANVEVLEPVALLTLLHGNDPPPSAAVPA